MVTDLGALHLPSTLWTARIRTHPRKAVTSQEPSSQINTKHIMHGQHALFGARTQKRMETEAGIRFSNCSPVAGGGSRAFVIKQPQDGGGGALFIIPTSAK